MVSTFYEQQITINRPCLVTVSHMKKVFFSPSVSSFVSALPEVVSHDKTSNHKSTWFQFSSRYHSMWLPSGCTRSLCMITPLVYDIP